MDTNTTITRWQAYAHKLTQDGWVTVGADTIDGTYDAALCMAHALRDRYEGARVGIFQAGSAREFANIPPRVRGVDRHRAVYPIARAVRALNAGGLDIESSPAEFVRAAIVWDVQMWAQTQPDVGQIMVAGVLSHSNEQFETDCRAIAEDVLSMLRS